MLKKQNDFIDDFVEELMKGVSSTSCYICKHYKESMNENECLLFRHYNYSTYKVFDCDGFDKKDFEFRIIPLVK